MAASARATSFSIRDQGPSNAFHVDSMTSRSRRDNVSACRTRVPSAAEVGKNNFTMTVMYCGQCTRMSKEDPRQEPPSRAQAMSESLLGRVVIITQCT